MEEPAVHRGPGAGLTASGDAYLEPEARARVEIDRMLDAAGWAVQDYSRVNLSASRGVAVREFVLRPGHGRADHLLFVDGRAVGVIEAKKAGETLTGVAWQTAKYLDGLPDDVTPALEGALPFAYQSTGIETRFTNLLDPDPASRPVFSFHQPGTLAGWTDLRGHRRAPTLPGRLRGLIQMATGSGKTFTAANVAYYRLVKHGGAKRGCATRRWRTWRTSLRPP